MKHTTPLFGVLAVLLADSSEHSCSAFITTLNARGSSFTCSSQRQTGCSSLLMAADDGPALFVADDALVSRRQVFSLSLGSVAMLSMASEASARLESVNNPALLPKEPGLNVIQVEKFLTSGQAKRMDKLLGALERDTGYRVKVLCQAYPNTPGLAIRDYWSLGQEGQKDDRYVVLVVDQFGGKGNVLNFNVGEGVKLALPNVFWTRLQAKFGNTFYVKENGIDLAITNAIDSIVSCLRSEDQYCVSVPDALPSMKSLGM
jgi:TPM domain